MTGRFNDGEVLAIAVLISGRMSGGFWIKYAREIGGDFDRILIWPANRLVDLHYRLHRDRDGMTHLLVCSGNDWRRTISGTLVECLDVLSLL